MSRLSKRKWHGSDNKLTQNETGMGNFPLTFSAYPHRISEIEASSGERMSTRIWTEKLFEKHLFITLMSLKEAMARKL